MPEQNKIKKAIKEALDDKRMDDISRQITDLSTQMTAGFSAVHTRQDLTNGKVLKNTTDIQKINDKAGIDKIIWLLVTSLVGLLTYFLTRGVK